MVGRVTVTGGNGDDFLEMLDLHVDKVGFDLEAELKMRSPVDTGQLRGGWHYDANTKSVGNNVEYVEAVNALHPTAAGFVEAATDAVVRRR